MSYTTNAIASRNGRTLRLVAATAAGLGIVAVIAASGVAVTDGYAAPMHHAGAAQLISSVQPAAAHGAARREIPARVSERPRPVPERLRPSGAVASLQRELGRLDYYEGPDDGVDGAQTVAAIKDLQRAAGLPQTGAMNAATDRALIHQLTFGDNQMGVNS